MSIERKIMRNAFREEATKRKYKKPARFVHKAWDMFQQERYGANTRKRNEAKGTHKKRTWKARVQAQFGK